jgi:hypothetical protein
MPLAPPQASKAVKLESAAQTPMSGEDPALGQQQETSKVDYSQED